ncbi:MAG: S9 family peptidase, partial [Planctomycetota bacterium]
MSDRRIGVAAVLAAFLLLGPLAAAGSAEETYRLPPDEIVRILDAPPTPSVSIDPTGTWMLVIDQPSMPSIAELAQPMLRLAGMRINPRTNGRFTTSYNVGLKLQRVSDNAVFPVALPVDARIGSPRWAPDGQRFAFTITGDNGIELW